MAKPLRWDARQVAREIEHYEVTIAAERASQEAATDQAADALLLDAPEIVPVIT
jgi:glycerol-3-phosphate dehydrogenase